MATQDNNMIHQSVVAKRDRCGRIEAVSSSDRLPLASLAMEFRKESYLRDQENWLRIQWTFAECLVNAL
jgi:hypothetical protein